MWISQEQKDLFRLNKMNFPSFWRAIIWWKNHTHVKKVGAHLRNSVWHLMVNLKNIYLLKKLLKWANKKCKNFNIYNVAFLLKNKEKHLRYHYFTMYGTKYIDIIYSSWDRLKLVLWAIFCLFTPPLKTQKIRTWKIRKNEKKICWRYQS